MRNNIEDIYSNGGYVESDGWSIKQIRVLGVRDEDTLGVGLTVRLSQERVVAADGSVEMHDAQTNQLLLSLEQDGTIWTMKKLELVP